MPSYQYGEIVIIEELLDPNDRNPKDRACVIVTPSDEIKEDGTLDVVAITSLVPDVIPFDQVPLPCHAQRHPRTGLNKKNVAVCSWQAEVEVSRVIRTIGHVPDKQMGLIAAALRILDGGASE
jgi:mRNA-degrading endonuclease toxin of MazEF toxin-antitoxin module